MIKKINLWLIFLPLFSYSQTLIKDKIINKQIDETFVISNVYSSQKKDTTSYFTEQHKPNITKTAMVNNQYIDSTTQKNKATYKQISEGYYPIKKRVDFDVLNLLSYNHYEGFRIQVGMKTNENLSDRFQLSGYKAYGFKDKEFKFRSSVRYKLKHQTQTYIKLTYKEDLEKSATFTPTNERSIFTPVQHLMDDKFYIFKGLQADFSHLLFPKLKIDINFTQGNTQTKYPITFHKGKFEFLDKDLAFFKAQLSITPFSKYYLAPEGRKLLKNGYPQFFVSFEKNIPQWQTDPYDYYRAEIQALFKKTYRNQNYTDLMIRTGFSSIGSGIDKLFSPVTNDYSYSNPLKRFSIEKEFSFETMKDLEFVDNFLISTHLQHTFKNIQAAPNFNFDLRLISRAAFGLSYDSNKYLGIKSLDNIYFESGIELRNLLKFAGLGFYYRLGYYAYPDTWDNLSIRLNLNPIKLFKN